MESGLGRSGSWDVRQACPACESRRLSTLIDLPYGQPVIRDYLSRQYEGRADAAAIGDARYRLCRCDECGLGFQAEVPAGPLLSDLYDRWIPPTERDRLRRERSLDDVRGLAEEIDLLVQRAGKPACDIKVLDFGLGWSEWARMALAFGCEVWGCELSAERIAHARACGISIIDLDAVRTMRFDFINTEQVFEHLTHPREVLAILSQALAPAGVLKINVPDARRSLRRAADDASMVSIAHQDIGPIAPLEHVNSFEHASLVAFGRRFGLEPSAPPIRQLYNASSGWLSPRRMVRLLLRPFYRHVYPRTTFVYFRRAA